MFLDPNRLSDADLAAWSALAGRAAEPNPFFEPEFMLPAVRNLGESGVRLLVTSDGDRWTGLLPVRRRGWWRLVAMPATTVWCHKYCFLGTPLIDAERIDEACAAVIDAALGMRMGFVALDYLAADGLVHEGLARAMGERKLHPFVYRHYERATVRRRPEPTYLDETRSPHHRRESKRQRRNLERDLGAEIFVDDRAGDSEAVEDFLRLECAGWKGEAGTALASRPGDAAFFREFCAGLHNRGALQLLGLRAADRLLAMQCNVRSGDTLFCFKIAVDETLRRYSPGVLLEMEITAHFHANPALMVADSCAAPENAMINRLWPDRRAITSLVVPPRGVVGRLARLEGRFGAALERRLRRAR